MGSKDGYEFLLVYNSSIFVDVASASWLDVRVIQGEELEQA